MHKNSNLLSNQAAIIWRAFELALGKNFYVNESLLPNDSMIGMSNAGTPESFKQHIVESIWKTDGHVTCTIAFGMGIDEKRTRQVVHFGPSQTVENYLQGGGRQSQCILLYNGLLAAHCSSDMKKLIQMKTGVVAKKL